MKCPFCGYEESKVIDSRPTDEGERIRRRRECLKCAKRFTTYEMIESLPAADVIPVRHGSIIETIEDGHSKRVFSCCGTDFTKMTCWMKANYCPNCGAKMDGECGTRHGE